MISARLLVAAYASGWFPMAADGEIRWYSPDPRGSCRSTRCTSRDGWRGWRGGGGFASRSIARLSTSCARARRTNATPRILAPGSDDEIIESYTALHEAGIAHSVETWIDDRLVGGLYGVALRGAFFGESMFHHETDASKVALVALVERLRARGYQLLDTQWVTPHLEQFGAVEIPRADYLRRLEQSLTLDCTFT